MHSYADIGSAGRGSLGGQFLREKRSFGFDYVGKNRVNMDWRSQIPNRDVLWGLLLIVVVGLLLWYGGIVEFSVGGRFRWQ
jgi:hypothetical protein